MEKEAVICAVLVFVTASAVTCVDDFVFTCPHAWKKGHIETLVCKIPVNKFSSSAPCDIYDGSVAFKYTKRGNPTTDCTVVNIDTVCDNSINLKGCGCKEKTATHVTVFYNVTASRNLHENAEWNCEPQCLTWGGDQVLAAKNSSACFRTVFFSKCDKNGQCKRGTCRIKKNKEGICDCTGTGFVGTFCEKLDPVLIALICVSTLLGLLMAANCAGVYCARKQRSGAQQNAPPADAPQVNDPRYNTPPANAPQVNDPRYNTPPANAPSDNAPQVNDPRYNTPPDSAPQVNDPRYNTPPDNAPPDNAPRVAGSAEPSTGQTVPTTPYDEPEFSVAGSEASEGTEYSASEVSEV